MQNITSSSTELITNAFASTSTAVLTILGLVIGLTIGIMVVYFGIRKLQDVLGNRVDYTFKDDWGREVVVFKNGHGYDSKGDF